MLGVYPGTSPNCGEYGRESALARGMATTASRPQTAGSASGSAAAALVHIGTAGWSYSDWEGIFYPKPHPRGFDPLEYVSRYVDVVEVNSTFYRPVDADVARRWVDRVADATNFRFT